jgi:hypothetical protein
MDNPVRDSNDAPVLRLIVPEFSQPDRSTWNLCGVGIKN